MVCLCVYTSPANARQILDNCINHSSLMVKIQKERLCSKKTPHKRLIIEIRFDGWCEFIFINFNGFIGNSDADKLNFIVIEANICLSFYEAEKFNISPVKLNAFAGAEPY